MSQPLTRNEFTLWLSEYQKRIEERFDALEELLKEGGSDCTLKREACKRGIDRDLKRLVKAGTVIGIVLGIHVLGFDLPEIVRLVISFVK